MAIRIIEIPVIEIQAGNILRIFDKSEPHILLPGKKNFQRNSKKSFLRGAIF